MEDILCTLSREQSLLRVIFLKESKNETSNIHITIYHNTHFLYLFHDPQAYASNKIVISKTKI